MSLGGSNWDVAIVGGGPAGSAAGAILAEAGKRVLIVDRERFPRFHVGESLLPFGNYMLRRLGLYDKMEGEGFVRKYGADFLPASSLPIVRVIFGNAFKENEQPGPAYNVVRARFDQMLLNNAQERGASVATGVSAKGLTVDKDKVGLTLTEGDTTHQVTASWLIDASGLGHFAGKALKLPRVELGISPKVVCFGHFKGVYRTEGRESGHVVIVRFPQGWFWFIPISDELTSVGMVRYLEETKLSGHSLEELFAQAQTELPEVRFRMKQAEQVGELHKVSDFTYRYKTVTGSRYFIVGDAATFIDPIFSSGVMMALTSGAKASDILLGRKDFSKPLSTAEQSAYRREFFRDSNRLLPMIRAFYDRDGYDIFMNPEGAKPIFNAMSRLLAGKFDLSLADRFRINLFYLTTYLQRYFKIAPSVSLK